VGAAPTFPTAYPPTVDARHPAVPYNSGRGPTSLSDLHLMPAARRALCSTLDIVLSGDRLGEAGAGWASAAVGEGTCCAPGTGDAWMPNAPVWVAECQRVRTRWSLGHHRGMHARWQFDEVSAC
jgi:hypothetical protein